MIRPWKDIKTFYQGLVAGGSPLQGMVRLVEQIEASRYVSGVHGETSMHDLCLAGNQQYIPRRSASQDFSSFRWHNRI
jgi:hypothetical protein